MDIYPTDFQTIQPCVGHRPAVLLHVDELRNGLPSAVDRAKPATPSVDPSRDVVGRGGAARRALHGGAVRESFRNKNPGSITATVTEDGVLWIDQPHMFLVGKWLHRDNWHVGDFNLFWSNIRDNVHERVEARGETP